MCVMSMIMDHYGDKWQKKLDDYGPIPNSPFKFTFPIPPTISPEEIKEFRELLDRAREYESTELRIG